MENCIYEDIDKLDSLSLSSSEQNSNQSYDISQKTPTAPRYPSTITNIPKANSTMKKYCKSPSFYFRNLNRNQAEALLSGQDNGVFLIRNSVNYKGNLTLSFINKGEFEHYLIERDKRNYVSINEDMWFSSVDKLVKHYQLHQENLSTVLTVALSSNELYIEASLNVNFIPIVDVKFNEFIGSGEFADVRKAELYDKCIAVKQFKESECSIGNSLQEAEIMSFLNHENVLRIYGISIQTRVLMYIEYMNHGCLLEYLRTRGRNLVDAAELIRYSYQISNGLEYLETKRIVHRDICASNILINRNKLAKISDFGSAISLNASRAEKLNWSGIKLRMKWTAPECLTGRNFSARSDVWSFGILLWEIFSYGRSPYPRVPIDYIERFILSGERMKIPDNCNPEMCQVIGSCWKLKASERPSFKNLKKIISYLIK